MNFGKKSFMRDKPPVSIGSENFLTKVLAKSHLHDHGEPTDHDASVGIDVDLREIYFLILHFLSAGPCKKSFRQLYAELQEHQLLPRRYHACYSRNTAGCREENVDGNSFPLSYGDLVGRYPHIQEDHLVLLLKQLMLMISPPLRCSAGKNVPSATDIPTLLGSGPFSLLSCDINKGNKGIRKSKHHLLRSHMHADQVRGLSLRGIGGGFPRHHRAPSIRLSCYTIAKPSDMVLKMQNLKKLRGHRDAVYCAIFDRTGNYVITGSDDRLVKIWSMETAFCLASCRGHEGDITDLSVSSNNVVVASASNDFTIRVWRLPDGYPISVLRGHSGAVTAIAFSPSCRPNTFYQLLSSSDDGTCRIWDARYSDSHPRVYMPKPAIETGSMLSESASSNPTIPRHQILFCAYNANGTAFVTGSSDTFARVWSACKPSVDDPDQPIREIDILAGHENDVNYVQFSGCALASRSSPSDSFPEDDIPKFKNSWFNHDSIVTCSRDGSAIIWVPKFQRSRGKFGRWVRSYHLKVPPPPMPPKLTRGGPRQRFLPTPRGVNMIVWSLDDRFVLAAIMDNRICVWNANDGSLVHSLAGHTASTYVLDVHPFNPRIAMSAGYDGKAILWDICEGNPVRIYDIGGGVKLVDGKFSQDGTSIVLSDDVGQIHLINTGEGESYQDAKYDQFFLGDYRPLTQDSYGSVIDQETQLSPYLRNMQDTLCDSSMLPYLEPYQSLYQRRRLGALGIEWRPSSVKFAVGTDIGMGQPAQVLPLPELDVILEPLPDYTDVIYWEPENDDNDSEYNANEDVFSEERTYISDNVSGSECSEDYTDNKIQKDYIRRSKRKKSALETEETSDRCIKKINNDDEEGTSLGVRKYKKSKLVRRSSGKSYSELKSLRSQRAAARNAISSFSNDVETSIAEVGSEVSLSKLSDRDLSLEDSFCQSKEHKYLDDKGKYYSADVRSSSDGPEDVSNSLRQPNSEFSGGNQKKLVIKFSLHQKSSVSSENHVDQVNVQSNGTSSSLRSCEDNLHQKRVDSRSRNLDPSNARMHNKELPENGRRLSEDAKTVHGMYKCTTSTSSCDTNARCGNLKIRLSNSSMSRAMPNESASEDANKCLTTQFEDRSLSAVMTDCGERLKSGGFAEVKTRKFDELKGSPSSNGRNNLSFAEKHSPHMQNNSSQKKIQSIKIKSSRFSRDASSQLRTETTSDASFSAVGSKIHQTAESPALRVSLTRNRTDEANFSLRNLETEAELANDSAPSTRYFKLKGSKQESSLAHDNLETRDEHMKFTTDIGRENMTVKVYDTFLSGPANSRNSMSSGIEKDHNYHQQSYIVERNNIDMPKKSNWLLLTAQEEGNRYIPQLGDEVVYLKQGHQDFIEMSRSMHHGRGVPYGDKTRAVEVCLVDGMEYTTHTGSGESCCQVTLKLIDPTCIVYGKKIQLALPELVDFPDFIVEKMWYDATMERNWSTRDICYVWWRDNTVQGGAWWEGHITAIKDKSSNFPGSPWERYHVNYKNDDTDYIHCPWELHVPERAWEQPTIDIKIKEKILNYFNKLLPRAHKNKDRYGIIKLNEAPQRMDFMNRFPVPLSLDVIKSRIENDYYRTLTALKHDFEVMLLNAKSYFLKNSEVLRRIKHLENCSSEFFAEL